MSLFLFQQKIPFNSVIDYLRVCEPGCSLTPDGWAGKQVDDIAPGDLVFIFEPIYSPWSDSSSGIGVAEGDSFSVSALALAHKRENGSLLAYVVKPDAFERHNLKAFLSEQAASARNNSSGFYYAICRAPAALTPDSLRDLSELDRFGNSGWRKDDNQPIDIVYSFCTAAAWGVMVHPGQQPDVAQIGYCLFCDKEISANSVAPDLRQHVRPVPKDQKREEAAPPADLGKPEEADAPAAPRPVPPERPKQMQLPKIPAFFKGNKPAEPEQPRGKTPRIIGPKTASGSHSTAPAQEPPAPEPPPSIELGDTAESNWETEQTPALTAEDLAAVAPSPPVPPELPPPAAPSFKAPPVMQDSPSADNPPAGGGQKRPAPIDMSIFAPMDDEALPQPEPPPPEKPAMPPQLDKPATPPQPLSAPPPLPRGAAPPPMPSMSAPPPLPASAAPPPVPPPIPQSAVPPLPQSAAPPPAATQAPSAADIATDIPSLAELLGNISRAAEADNPPSGEAEVPTPEPDTAAATAAGGPQIKAPEIHPVKSASEPSLVSAGPPSKKKSDERDVKERPLKEPITVKSGVAGLVSKLEQQASKASSRLEAQVDEIQSRLSNDLSELLAKVNSSETRSIRNAQDLRAELTERMDSTASEVIGKIGESSREGGQKLKQQEAQGGGQLDEKHEYVRTALNSSFDEVKARSEAIVKTFEESLLSAATASVSELEALRDRLTGELAGLYAEYETAMDKAFDTYKERLVSAGVSVTATVEARSALLQGQLAEIHQRSTARLQQIRTSYVNQLNKQFAVTRAEVRKLRASSLEETVVPRLRQHRDELRIVTSEFQNKLAEDLDRKCEEKLAEFDPILVEKKKKLAEVLQSTEAVKDQMEEQLRQRLQKIAEELKQFVEKSVSEAQTAYKQTEDQLAEFDRAVRALADQSSIEGDLELLNERNQVLSAMDEATENAKDEVLSTLRTSLASLEEKGKQLQEELISSMEEDAYRVRRSSEQALNAIRDAIKDAFRDIQTAQDERMPM